jgi:hypothetical protein
MLKRSLSKLVKVVKIVKNAKIVMTVKIAASTLSLLVSVALPLSAQNRVPQLIPAGSVRVAIANTINPRVRQSTDLGEANANQPLSLSLRFNMTTAQTTALQHLARSLASAPPISQASPPGCRPRALP